MNVLGLHHNDKLIVKIIRKIKNIQWKFIIFPL